MMQIIIISKNQQRHLMTMREALEADFAGVNRLFVLDRCTDDSENILKSAGEKFIVNREGEGFLAGKMRDFGLDHLGIHNTLFLDGDRIPMNLNEKICADALDQYDMATIRMKSDTRLTAIELAAAPEYGKHDNMIHSAGILIGEKVINAIRISQNGRLFHPAFDGLYGNEDLYLGDVAFKLGFTCGEFPFPIRLSGDPATWKTCDKNIYRLQVEKRLKLRELLGFKNINEEEK